MSSLYIICVIYWAFAESFSALFLAQTIALRSVLSICRTGCFFQYRVLTKRATPVSLLRLYADDCSRLMPLYTACLGKEQGCGGNLIRLGTFVFGVR